MRCIRVLICRVDDNNEDQMTELASFAMPEVDLSPWKPETALDELEATPYEQGPAILRRLLQAQWAGLDKALAEQYCQRFSPGGSEG